MAEEAEGDEDGGFSIEGKPAIGDADYADANGDEED